MKNHPYAEYISFEAWDVLSTALKQLEENQDLERKTNADYITGYLIKSLNDKSLLIKKNIAD